MIEKVINMIEEVLDVVNLDCKVVNLEIDEFGDNDKIYNYYIGVHKNFVRKILKTLIKSLEKNNKLDLTKISYKYDTKKNVYKLELVEFESDFIKCSKKTTIEILEVK